LLPRKVANVSVSYEKLVDRLDFISEIVYTTNERVLLLDPEEILHKIFDSDTHSVTLDAECPTRRDPECDVWPKNLPIMLTTKALELGPFDCKAWDGIMTALRFGFVRDPTNCPAVRTAVRTG
jgi:hypothetical protein